jgi:hypothetical protein
LRDPIISRADAANNQTQFISHDAGTRQRVVAISTRWIFLALEIESGTESLFAGLSDIRTPTHRVTITVNRGCESASIVPRKVVAVCGSLQAMRHRCHIA